jgi:hypothetical protein
MRPDQQDEIRLLIASQALPLSTPVLGRIARALPWVAEDWAARAAPEIVALRDFVETQLWPAARERSTTEPATNWPEVAAACLEAAEVLGLDLDPRAQRGGKRQHDFPKLEPLRAEIGRPRVHVLLPDRSPTRVLLACTEADVEPATEPIIQRCRELARTFLHGAHTPQWRLLEPQPEDLSQMAGLLLRLVAEHHLPDWMARRNLGITGELDDAGQFLPVTAVVERVRRFFAQYDDGLCLVPVANWTELVRELRPTRDWRENSRRLSARHWERVIPVTSLRQLLVCLGHESGPDAELIARLRECARTVMDWRGTCVDAHRLQELSLRPTDSDGGASSDQALGALVEHMRTPGVRGVVLSGVPGSGKSMLLARLFYELNAGELALNGPALLVRARRLGSVGRLTQRLEPELPGIRATQLEALLAEPNWRGRVWLLIDGLDELGLAERRWLLAEMRTWPGPLIVATRRLRETERVPDMVTREIAELDNSQREALWRLFEGAYLDGRPRYESWRDSAGPQERIWQDLGRTPLGVSLLAAIPDLTEPAQRSKMLYRAILHLMERAEVEKQISPDVRRSFERRGLRFAGAAAWYMLRGEGAVLQLEALEWATRRLALDSAEEDLLSQGLDASGFVQQIGTGEREFSHKCFAELCAALFLEQEEELIRELWPRVGDPGIDEVVLHLAMRAGNATPYLRELLAARERPLSSLALAMRLLVECQQAATSLTMELLIRRIRLLTRFAGWTLPADLGHVGPLWQVLKRWSAQLEPHVAELVAAFPEDVRSWLYEETPRADNERYGWLDDRERQCRDMAERLHDALRFSIPLRNLLRFKHRGEVLARWPRERLSREIAVLREDPEPEVRDAARELWVEMAPVAYLLPLLDVSVRAQYQQYVTRILQRVVESGTRLEQREALIRAGLASFGFRYWSESSEMHLTALLEDSRFPSLLQASHQTLPGAAWWLERWSWAWRLGFLGAESYGNASALEELYAQFLLDATAEARWRALVALRSLHSKEASDRATPAEGVARVAASIRPLIHDDARSVRVEAVICLLALGDTVFVSELLPLCASVDDGERWVAWHAALTTGMLPSCRVIVDVLAPRTTRQQFAPYQQHWQERWEPALPRMEETTKRHGQEARRKLIEWAGTHCMSTQSQRHHLYDCLDHPQYTSVADEILTTVAWGRDRQVSPLAELHELLATGRPGQRRWAVDRLARDSRFEAAALLLPLQNDHDPEIATKARELAKRQMPESWKPNQLSKPSGFPVRELTSSSIRGFGWPGLPDEQTKTASCSFHIGELPRFLQFEALWQSLGKRPLALQTWHDVDYEGRDDRVDHIDLLADRAWEQNLDQVKPIRARLQELYRPENRALLLRDLDHPLLGFWAELLLSMQPPERDLLSLVRRSERCAERVARLARKTPLASEVTRALIDTIVDGKLLPIEPAEHSWQPGRYMLAGWQAEFVQLAGDEGIVQLLQANPAPTFGHGWLRYLHSKRDELSSSMAAEPRQWLASVLRVHAENGDEQAQAMALGLLSVFGEPRDAAHWAGRLRERSLPESVAAAAVGFLAGQLGSAAHVPLLRWLVQVGAPRVREAALAALVQWGDVTDIELFLSFLRPVEQVRGRAMPEPPRSSRLALEGIVRLGNREHAQRLAHILLDDTNQYALDEEAGGRAHYRGSRDAFPPRLGLEDVALDIAGRHGYLPEHALLIIGALLHDPGDHEYGVDVSGYDEIYVRESPVPGQACSALEAILARTDREAVRQAFLECTLAGGPSSTVARRQLDELGGVRDSDVPVVLACLERRPDSQEALALLSQLNDTEQSLARIWERQKCSWWTSGDTSRDIPAGATESSPGQDRRRATDMHTLRIFHISDLHARGARDHKRTHKREMVLGDAWQRNLDDLSDDGRAFDLVVFTGDIADWGVADEYDAATPFLMKTLELLHVSPERLFVIPGNHDVNRDTEAQVWAKLREGIAEHRQAVSEWISGSRGKPPFGFEPTWLDAVLRREQAFWSWVERDLGRGELLPQRSAHGRLGYSVDVPGLPVPVRMIGLDSAWLAGDDSDAGRLWLTEDQLGLLCLDPNGKQWPGFRLALMHHPLSDLADRAAATRRLSDTVDLLLRGHQHDPIAHVHTDPDRTMRELAAGCLFDGAFSNRHPNGCHVIDAVLDGTGRPQHYDIRFRSWSPNGHWHDDGGIYCEARGGRLTWRVSRPTSILPAAASVAPASAIADVRQRYAAAIERAEAARRTLTAIVTSASAAGGVVPLDTVYLAPHLLRMPGAAVEFTTVDLIATDNDLARSGGLLEDWVRVTTDEQRLLFVVGEMGRGKTELVHHMRRTLARIAQEDPTAPLPILVRARDLGTGVVDRQDLARAAATQLAMQADTLRTLLADSSNRWIYLIDGLDEAVPAVRETILALANDPEWRAVRVIVTSRPAAVPLDAGQVLLSLPPWNSGQVDRFLDRWHTVDAATVDALRASPHYRDASGELLANPLTATLCLALMRQKGRLPFSRAALFVELIEILFQDWARDRTGNSTKWRDIAPALEQVALQHVRERSPHITRDRLKKALRTVAKHDAQELERASEYCFGVLVRLEDGSGYEFLFRGLAEHLAGAALLEQGHEAIIEVAYAPWAEEVVRHAIGLAMERNQHEEGLVLLRLLVLIGRPCAEPADQWLRPLLTAIRTAADVPKPANPWARELVVATLRGLLEEESHWVGDRVADAVQVLAAAGGPITRALWRYCYQRLMESTHEPMAWYAAQHDRHVAWWLRALRHRDAKVRAVACERLAAHVDDHEVREQLLLMLFDDWAPGVSPALLAGAALRNATRDTHFEGIREVLLDTLAGGGQFSAGGAALALRPDEAQPRALAHALTIAYEGTREIQAGPVYALDAAPGGREALEAEWPQWREGLVEAWHYQTWIPKLSETGRSVSRPPLSHRVRHRIVRAFSTGLHHLDSDELIAAQAHHMDGSIDELCRAVYHRPAEVLPYLRLNTYHGTNIPVDAQRNLGRAAAKHPLVRDALIASWELNLEARRVYGAYPGVALEPLVLRGDEEAIAIYAAWLPVSCYVWPFDIPIPDPAVFTVAKIKEAALAEARYIWDYATNGQVKDDGKRSWFAPQSTGIALHYRWPAWIDDSVLVGGLCQWLEEQDDQKFIAAAWAFVGGPVTGQVRQLVERIITERIRLYIDSPTNSAHDVKWWLRAMERLGIGEIGPLLAKMAGLGTATSALAAAMLIPTLTTSEARALSESIAAASVVPSGYILDTHQLRFLVQAAPEAWVGLVKRDLAESQSPDLPLRLLPHLPDAHRLELARLLHQADVESDLPWTQVSDGGGPLVYARPADVVARVIFEAGLLIEEDAAESSSSEDQTSA